MGSARGGSQRLPDFLIIGAPRSGTTSLSYYLNAHPGTYVSKVKELNFFNRFEPTPEALRSYSTNFADALPDQVCGEASPVYLYSRDAAARMRAAVPDARLVAILRNPVDRAYSHYWWRRLWPAEDREFRTAVDDEIAGRAPDGAEYLGYGRYHEQLLRLSEHFPRESTLVLLLDDLQRDPERVFAALCRHIGVDDTVRPPIVGEKINTTGAARWRGLSRRLRTWRGRPGWKGAVAGIIDARNLTAVEPPPMDADVRESLVEYFSAPNVRLSEWLGLDLSMWR